jgi:hypothetical protein
MEHFVCLQKPAESGKVFLIAGPFNDERSAAQMAITIETKHQQAEADRYTKRYFFGPPDLYAPDDIIGYDNVHRLRTHRALGNITIHRRSYLGFGTDGPQVITENEKSWLPDCRADAGTETGIQAIVVPGDAVCKRGYAKYFHVPYEEKHKDEDFNAIIRSQDLPWLLGYYEGYKAETETIRSKK